LSQGDRFLPVCEGKGGDQDRIRLKLQDPLGTGFERGAKVLESGEEGEGTELTGNHRGKKVGSFTGKGEGTSPIF